MFEDDESIQEFDEDGNPIEYEEIEVEILETDDGEEYYIEEEFVDDSDVENLQAPMLDDEDEVVLAVRWTHLAGAELEVLVQELQGLFAVL